MQTYHATMVHLEFSQHPNGSRSYLTMAQLVSNYNLNRNSCETTLDRYPSWRMRLLSFLSFVYVNSAKDDSAVEELHEIA